MWHAQVHPCCGMGQHMVSFNKHIICLHALCLSVDFQWRFQWYSPCFYCESLSKNIARYWFINNSFKSQFSFLLDVCSSVCVCLYRCICIYMCVCVYIDAYAYMCVSICVCNASSKHINTL